MAEYIDREELKDRMAGFIPPCIDESNRAYVDGLIDAYTLICQAPAADVRPVVRGKWEGRKTFFHYRIVKCSLCGNFLDLDGVNAGRGDANFCPNCGAKMIGGDDDV